MSQLSNIVNQIDSVKKLNHCITANNIDVSRIEIRKHDYRDWQAYFNRVSLDAYEDDNSCLMYDYLAYNEELYRQYRDIDEDESCECSIIDAISYWKIYYSPDYYNESLAYECGLVPFQFDDKKLLALGGCGMDLSPKLDAYQALANRTIDKNSTFFKQKDYFSYVVGDKITQRVEKAILLKNPIIELTMMECA